MEKFVNATDPEVGIYSFGRLQKKGNVPICQYVVDVSGLRDPFSNRGFKSKFKNGLNDPVLAYVREDDRMQSIIHTVDMITDTHLRGAGADKKWLSIGFRDHHGLWTAPAVAEIIARSLKNSGYRVLLFHYNTDLR